MNSIVFLILGLFALSAVLLFIYKRPKDDIVPMSAEQAREVRKIMADKQSLDKLLAPVFKDIDKAASKGMSEIGLFKRDWYNQDKLLYQKAVSKLQSMGYNVRFDYSYQAVIVSW